MKKLLIILLISAPLGAMIKQPAVPAGAAVKKSAPVTYKSQPSTLSYSSPQQQQELQFINAIADGNLAEVSKFINAPGFDPNKSFTIAGFNGHTPLSIAMRDNIPVYKIQNNTLQLVERKDTTNSKYKILELLISKGLDLKQLLGSLSEAVAAADAVKTRWLITNSKPVFAKNPQLDNQWASAMGTIIAQAKQLSEKGSDANKFIWKGIHDDLEKLAQQNKAKR